MLKKVNERYIHAYFKKIMKLQSIFQFVSKKIHNVFNACWKCCLPGHNSIVGTDNHQEEIETKGDDHSGPVGVAD